MRFDLAQIKRVRLVRRASGYYAQFAIDIDLKEDRDINAAINILRLGLSTVGHTGTSRRRDLPSWAIGVNLLFNGESLNQESPCL